MLRTNSRRRSEDGASHICIAVSVTVILLFVSFFVFHAQLSSSPFHSGLSLTFPSESETSTLFVDDEEKDTDSFETAADDRIDVMDDEKIPGDDDSDQDGRDRESRNNGFSWDHVIGVKRRAFGGSEGLDDDIEAEAEDGGRWGKVAFSSDDMPVDEEMRVKLNSIRAVEDALLVKTTGAAGEGRLREGWAKWYEEKGRFLRQDRMFASSLELFNPLKHPLLQDPDVPGGSVLSRGDKLLRRAMWKELDKVPFEDDGGVGRKRIERRALNLDKEKTGRRRFRSGAKGEDNLYPDGKRWGYYPAIEPELPFSKFMDKFLLSGQCSFRVFMVWNSPSWSYGVRHQRGLESLLHHHKDACVVVFSEMMELDFFSDYVKDGYKVALAMPDLDDLLKDTPVSAFASTWNYWRKTKYYPIHYSELIRLAALYKYGGMYLDSDVIVLKPLDIAGNFIVMENKTSEHPIINGAVMAFEKHSPFVMECLKEFHSSYDDTRVTWNGAELLTRVFKRIYGGNSNPDSKLNFTIHDADMHFPISHQDITSYFSVASDDHERSQQDILFHDILDGSKTFHFWNSVTSALVPETGSLVERLINRYCLFCLDVL